MIAVEDTNCRRSGCKTSQVCKTALTCDAGMHTRGESVAGRGAKRCRSAKQRRPATLECAHAEKPSQVEEKMQTCDGTWPDLRHVEVWSEEEGKDWRGKARREKKGEEGKEGKEGRRREEKGGEGRRRERRHERPYRSTEMSTGPWMPETRPASVNCQRVQSA